MIHQIAEAPTEHTEPADENLIPAWLAVLVLVLLLGVMGLGGFVVRGIVAGDRRARTPQELEVNKWAKEVKANPDDPKAHLALGYAYQSDGRYKEALDQYRIVLEASPRDTAALYNRGVVYLKLGVADRAEQSFWEVLNVEPTHALAAKALGESYARKREYKSLVEAVRPAVIAHPEMADLQYLMGEAYENLGNKEWAAERYRLALKYSPDMTEARDGLKRLGVTP